MKPSEPRVLRRAHASRGRLRLRLPWLKRRPAEATRLADLVVALGGMERVEVRLRTGSLLCLFDPARLEAEDVVAAVCRHSGAVEIGAGDDAPLPERRRASALGRVLARSAAGINQDILEASDGTLDLGTVAALGFLTLAAGEIALTRTLPIPQWSSLAWWAFRTFTEFELHVEDEG